MKSNNDLIKKEFFLLSPLKNILNSVKLIKNNPDLKHFKLEGNDHLTLNILIHRCEDKIYTSIFLGKEKLEFCNFEISDSKEDLKLLREDINKILRSSIKEELIYVKGSLKKITYTLSELDSSIKLSKGFINFLNKKNKIINYYSPWISLEKDLATKINTS